MSYSLSPRIGLSEGDYSRIRDETSIELRAIRLKQLTTVNLTVFKYLKDKEIRYLDFLRRKS